MWLIDRVRWAETERQARKVGVPRAEGVRGIQGPEARGPGGPRQPEEHLEEVPEVRMLQQGEQGLERPVQVPEVRVRGAGRLRGCAEHPGRGRQETRIGGCFQPAYGGATGSCNLRAFRSEKLNSEDSSDRCHSDPAQGRGQRARWTHRLWSTPPSGLGLEPIPKTDARLSLPD